MTSFTRQRIIGIVLLAALTAATLLGYARYAAEYPRLSYFSGAVLFFIMVILTLFNGRKKLPFLPLGTAEGWLQFHIYAGFLTVALFAVHIRFRAPTGWFDIILAALYLLVAGSGVAGLFVTRSAPKRLTTRGGEVLYERIPAIRRA